jgi:hypothetical protein
VIGVTEVEEVMARFRAENPEQSKDVTDEELRDIIAPRLLPSILEGTELHLLDIPDSNWYQGFVFEPPCWTQKSEKNRKELALHYEGYLESVSSRQQWLCSMRKAICNFLGFGR